MMKSIHEVFEHTADLGLRIRAATLNALLAEAGVALFSLMVENLENVQPVITETVRIEQPDNDLLLFDWLNELLYLFDARQLLLSRFAVEVKDHILLAQVSGEPRDEQKHLLDHEVKAITYHQLKVEEQADSTWLAEVILDI